MTSYDSNINRNRHFHNPKDYDFIRLFLRI